MHNEPKFSGCGIGIRLGWLAPTREARVAKQYEKLRRDRLKRFMTKRARAQEAK
jgi:hypothetical protein